MNFSTRLAKDTDFGFLFELKKAAEFEPINAVFGWDEKIQQEIHQVEWDEEKPNIIEMSGRPVGSYLLQNKGDYLYFCRFFLLPEFHSKGIGSQILTECLESADYENKAVHLCYLQGNCVGGLYRKFGFEITSEDSQFIHMIRARMCL